MNTRSFISDILDKLGGETKGKRPAAGSPGFWPPHVQYNRYSHGTV